MLKKFSRNMGGNVTLILAIVAPALLGSMALATDYFVLYQRSSQLQQTADAAALAVAKELGIAGFDTNQVDTIANSFVASNFYYNEVNSSGEANPVVTTKLSDSSTEVTVKLAYYWQPFFAHYLSSKVLPINVETTAGLAGSNSICTLALDQKANKAIELTGTASIRADKCTIQSNSHSRSGIKVPTHSKLKAANICVSGGYKGSGSSYSPTPTTDCPALADPFSDRVFPKDFTCDYKGVAIAGRSRVLEPGVYCGGLFITDKSRVNLRPGVYVFVDGDLDIGGGSRINGSDISLYFAQDSRLFIRNSTDISLSARKSGTMAGILVAASASNKKKLVFEVQSKNARKFAGLVYTPNNRFKIGDDTDGDGKCDPENDVPRGLEQVSNDDDDDDDNSDNNDFHSHFHRHENGFFHEHWHFQDKTHWHHAGQGEDADKKSETNKYPSELGDSEKVKHASDPGNNTYGCQANIGASSDWTAIIARKVQVTSGVKLVLNANFAGSEIPIPENEGLIGTQPRLIK